MRRKSKRCVRLSTVTGSFSTSVVAADGWLRSGDAVRVDDEGFFFVVDRWKDMFISGGFNANPAEIERLLLTHPGVAQAAVIGVPDERLGEVGMAFVVPSAGTTLDPEAVVTPGIFVGSIVKIPRTATVAGGIRKAA